MTIVCDRTKKLKVFVLKMDSMSGNVRLPKLEDIALLTMEEITEFSSFFLIG